MSQESPALVESYLRYLSGLRVPADADGPSFAALMQSAVAETDDEWEELNELVTSKPDAAWPLLLEIIERSEDEDLPAIAADILGTFVVHHGAKWADRIEAEIRANDRFFGAFQRVKMTGVPLEAQQRFNRALLDRGADPRYVVEYDESDES